MLWLSISSCLLLWGAPRRQVEWKPWIFLRAESWGDDIKLHERGLEGSPYIFQREHRVTAWPVSFRNLIRQLGPITFVHLRAPFARGHVGSLLGAGWDPGGSRSREANAMEETFNASHVAETFIGENRATKRCSQAMVTWLTSNGSVPTSESPLSVSCWLYLIGWLKSSNTCPSST